MRLLACVDSSVMCVSTKGGFIPHVAFFSVIYLFDDMTIPDVITANVMIENERINVVCHMRIVFILSLVLDNCGSMINVVLL